MEKAIWQSIPLERSLAAYAADWDRLNQCFFGGHPMFDSRFVGCLLKYFGDGSERLLLLKRETETVGLSVLRPNRLGIWKSFFPSQAQASPVLVEDDRSLQSIFQALPGLANQIDFLGQDPDYSVLRDTLTTPRQSIAHAKTISIKLDDDFEGYWRNRPKKLAQNIRRYQNRLAESGGQVRFVILNDPGAMRDGVDRYGKLESAGWKGKVGTALAIDNVQGQFYAELMEQFALTGQALIYEYWIDDQLAASRLVIHHQRMMVMLKTAYDESLANFAPGRLLMYEVIRDAFTRMPGGTIEFYTDATQDQLAWATHSRVISHQMLFQSEARCFLWQLIKAAKHSRNRGETSKQSCSVESIPADECAFPDQCQELFAESEKTAFDFGLPWFQNLAATVTSEERAARMYVGYADDKPRAILPMFVPSDGGGDRGEAFGNYYTTLYQPILSPQASVEDLSQIVSAISRDFPNIAEMRFSPLDPESQAALDLRDALQRAGWVTFNYFCFGNWYLPVTGNWEEYFVCRYGGLRNTIRRMAKKLAAAGGRLEIVTGGERLDTGIAAFASVYAASWKKAEPYPDFIPGLIRMLARTDRLRLGIVWLKNQPIAAQIWVVNHGKASIYKVAYDEGFAMYSPGTVLSAHLMEHVIDRDKVQEVDYLIGDDAYKRTWMTHRRERWGIVACNPRTLKGLAQLSRECLARTAKRMVGNEDAPAGDLSGARRFPQDAFGKILFSAVGVWRGLSRRRNT